MVYKVFYKSSEIGVLEINDSNQYKYTPDEAGTHLVKNQISFIKDLLKKSDWGAPIPFFKVRIDNAKRFSKENDISSHTDHFRMLRV